MGYDTFLLNQADMYNSSCEPTVVRVEKEYEGRDYDGTPCFSETHVINCEECDEKECGEWLNYNDGEPCHVCGEQTGLNCYECDQPLCEKCKCDCELNELQKEIVEKIKNDITEVFNEHYKGKYKNDYDSQKQFLESVNSFIAKVDLFHKKLPRKLKKEYKKRRAIFINSLANIEKVEA